MGQNGGDFSIIFIQMDSQQYITRPSSGERGPKYNISPPHLHPNLGDRLCSDHIKTLRKQKKNLLNKIYVSIRESWWHIGLKDNDGVKSTERNN